MFYQLKQQFNVKKQYLLRKYIYNGYKKKKYFYSMKKIITFLPAFLLLNISLFSQTNSVKIEDKYLTTKFIIKIRPALKEQCYRNSTGIASVNYLLEKYNYSGIEQKFPHSVTPRSAFLNETDITTIYTVSLSDSMFLHELVQELSSVPEIEYAQLHYLPELLYQPDDPLISSQWHLNNINAYDAWDICQGNSNIIIGITDTGTDYGHPDLVDNVAYNLNDIVNGIDDDHDGFVDNFRGWDLGDNDNSAQWNDAGTSGDLTHGVYVCGFAASATDNATGTASPGFNCSFLPVKINDASGMLVASYDGIVYAADHGCRIINCSWGGITPHPYGQDIINYATYNRNSLVIAASGNNGNTTNNVYYPCAFENVLCVGASTSLDKKWYKSSYGRQVDVTAPGESVYGPGPNNSYVNSWGTSFASPIAASAAGLILSHHNDTLSALQLGHILRLSCDNIDTIPDNIPYAGMMGKGRINVFNALSMPLTPALEFKNIVFSESITSDSCYIDGIMWNYLAPATNVTTILSCTNQYIQIEQNMLFIDSIGFNTFTDFTSPPFSLLILPGIPYDETIEFKLTINSGSYSEEQFFKINLNLSFLDFDTNNLKLTICSNGRLGYNSLNPVQGYGVRHNNEKNFLSDGGLIVAYSPTKSISSVYYRNDFKIHVPVYQNLSALADYEYISEYNDSLAHDTLRTGLQVKQQVFAWDNNDASDFCIIRYTLYNTSSLPLSSVYAGLYFDWDLINPALNSSNYFSSNKLSVIKYQGISTLIAGVIALSDHPSNHYSFDLVQGGNGGIDIYGDYTASEIYRSLTENRFPAGVPNATDIALVTGYGPFYIPSMDSVVIDYAILAAESDYFINQIADTAIAYYQQRINNSEIISSESISCFAYPNPAQKTLFITCPYSETNIPDIKIYDIRGIELYSHPAVSVKSQIDVSNFKSGIYFIQVSDKTQTYRTKICIN